MKNCKQCRESCKHWIDGPFKRDEEITWGEVALVAFTLFVTLGILYCASMQLSEDVVEIPRMYQK